MEISKAQPKDWNCSICDSVMDGESKTGGDISISKRCFHIFHDVCIKEWVVEHKGNCPECRLKNLSVVDLMSNLEYVKQYNIWKANPEKYHYDKQLLRPEPLRGKPWREKMSREEAKAYRDNIAGQIKKLEADSDSWEKIEKLKEEYEEAEEYVLNFIEQDQKKISDRLDTGDLCREFQKKLEVYGNRALSAEVSLLKDKENPINKERINEIQKFYDDSFVFCERFREANKISLIDPNSPSSEEAQAKLRKIYEEMEAFIDGQPEELKNVLRTPPKSKKNIPLASLEILANQNSQDDDPKDPRRFNCGAILKVMFVALSILSVYAFAHFSGTNNLS